MGGLLILLWSLMLAYIMVFGIDHIGPKPSQKKDGVPGTRLR